MIDQIDNDIVRKYPFLFGKCFEFSVCKGWYPLIDRLCSFIEKNEPETEIVQIKEKFGLLTFYVDGGSEYLYELIELAQIESSKLCEECGSYQDVEKKGTFAIRTLCKDCKNKNE